MGLGWGLSYWVVCSLIVDQQRSSLGVQSNSPGSWEQEKAVYLAYVVVFDLRSTLFVQLCAWYIHRVFFHVFLVLNFKILKLKYYHHPVIILSVRADSNRSNIFLFTL